MVDTSLAIDILKRNTNSKVYVALPGTSGQAGGGFPPQVVIGFTKSQLSIGASNQFNTPDINAGQQALSNTINNVMGFLNQWFDEEVVQMRIQHPGQTINSWVGSQRPTFSIPLMFIAIYPDDNVVLECLKLYRAAFGEAVGGGIFSRYLAPLGYAPSFVERGGVSSGGARGTIAIQIGRWFRALNLVMKSVNFSFSEKTTRQGWPIFAEGTVELEPYKAIGIREFEQYFSGFGELTGSGG